MLRVGSKSLVVAVILILITVACSSNSTSPDPGESSASESPDKQVPESNAPNSVDDTSALLGESGSTEVPPTNASETVQPEPTASNEPEEDEPAPAEPPASDDSEENKPTPEPTPEQDVIPFVTTQEESSIVAIQEGGQYPGGTLVGSADIGLAFTIPKEWTGLLPQGSPAFILGSQTKPGLVILTSQQSNDIDEIVQTLSQPLPIDQGVVLQPKGQPIINGAWVEVQASASDGVDQFDGYAMALVRDSGVGIFIAAIGPDSVEYYKSLASEIALSTRAVKTTVASDQSESAGVDGADSTALAKEWTDFLAGMRATYLSSYSSGSSGGFSDKSEFDFCSDGQFAQSGSSSLSIDTMGASAFSGGSSGGSGTWKIITQGDKVIVELKWSDGSVGQSLLEYIDNKTYIDGERYFVTPDNTTCP